MTPTAGGESDRSGRIKAGFAAAAAVAVLAWRLLVQSPGAWWRDWGLLLALFGLLSLRFRRSPAWPTVTACVMAFLLGLYAYGQLPFTLRHLGMLR